jgi:hypothetical protein
MYTAILALEREIIPEVQYEHDAIDPGIICRSLVTLSSKVNAILGFFPFSLTCNMQLSDHAAT